MKLSIAILGHEQSAKTECEFQPFWNRYQDATKCAILRDVHGSHYKGNETIRRLARVCKQLMSDHPTDVYIVTEYDTIPLRNQVPEHIQGVSCHLMKLVSNDAQNGKVSALPPWIITHDVMAKFIEALEKQSFRPEPEWTLGGLTDRLVGEALSNASHIPAYGSRDVWGYSHEGNMSKIIAARNPVFLHGIKSLEPIKDIL